MFPAPKHFYFSQEALYLRMSKRMNLKKSKKKSLSSPSYLFELSKCSINSECIGRDARNPLARQCMRAVPLLVRQHRQRVQSRAATLVRSVMALMMVRADV